MLDLDIGSLLIRSIYSAWSSCGNPNNRAGHFLPMFPAIETLPHSLDYMVEPQWAKVYLLLLKLYLPTLRHTFHYCSAYSDERVGRKEEGIGREKWEERREGAFIGQKVKKTIKMLYQQESEENKGRSRKDWVNIEIFSNTVIMGTKTTARKQNKNYEWDEYSLPISF